MTRTQEVEEGDKLASPENAEAVDNIVLPSRQLGTVFA